MNKYDTYVRKINSYTPILLKHRWNSQGAIDWDQLGAYVPRGRGVLYGTNESIVATDVGIDALS